MRLPFKAMVLVSLITATSTGCGIWSSRSDPVLPRTPDAVSRSPAQAELRLTLQAASDVNPDAKGRPSPVVVRVFELRSMALFQSADFFTLYERDRETLASELVSREEVAITPGTTVVLQRRVDPSARFVAVLVAFRDLDRASWRASQAVGSARAGRPIPLEVRIEDRRVQFKRSDQ